MADVRLNIANREYIVTCRDGEEEHLRKLAVLVDDMAKEAGGSAGGLNESRQLLFASLLLADKVYEGNILAEKSAASSPENSSRSNDIALEQAAAAIEKLADRLETFANKLEN